MPRRRLSPKEYPRLGVGTARPAQHVSERTGANQRDFPEIPFPVDEPNAPPPADLRRRRHRALGVTDFDDLFIVRYRDD